jgi:hypothetical protein
MPSNDATLGFRAHSGWAVMVAVAGGLPVLRRRIEMVTGTGMRARQPYHAAEGMRIAEAQAFLDRTEAAAVEMAAAAIRDTIHELESAGHHVRRAVVLLGSGKPLPELAKILSAHPLIHTAEGVFYRNVLQTACARCGLSTIGLKEREVPADFLAKTAAMGKLLGPPWTQDEKLATSAALSKQRSLTVAARFAHTRKSATEPRP